MKKQIVHVSRLQTAKVMALLYLVISLPMVLIMAIPVLLTGQGFSLAMLVFMPILYAVCGFVFTFLGAWIYNWVASLVGGIEFSTAEVAGE